MQEQKLSLIHSFLNDIIRISDQAELDSLTESYAERLGIDPSERQEDMIYKLWQDAAMLGGKLIAKTDGESSGRNKRLEALTDEEKAELTEVESVISENRFDYHFQPIVNASDGEIYSYEALMRPRSEKKLSPYHIIKYAELTERLDDIERATFLNVLNIIDTKKEMFSGRRVFLNSIPNTKLYGDDLRNACRLLVSHSDTVVVEMTEQSEPDEYELSVLKERYRNMNVQIAIDDYGTGYSNVKNLLMYMPNYVKIDRSLLSEIQNSPTKRHFVREIIEFCHDNGIMALAEGVETSEELHSVILLGVDLIQGFYTARPNAEVIDAIPHDIRQEIKRYSQERQDGKDQQIYTVEGSERILLDKLVRDDYKCILIGNGDVTIVGQPLLDTDIHIEVSNGFKGRITLENVSLSNVKNRPCIDIGDDCEAVLVMLGENKLDKSGIRVPESSKLTFEGEGGLSIRLSEAEGFGIGNGISFKHGELIFDQQGCIRIDADCKTAIGIGSGLGGKISVKQGQYILNISGDMGIAIGAFYADCELDIYSSDISTDISVSRGAAIGSLTCRTDVHIWKSSAKLYMGGTEITAIGTVGGDSCSVLIDDANVIVNIRAARCTCVGALDGSSSFSVERASFRGTATGEKALAFGGFSKDTKASFIHADTTILLETEDDYRKYLSEDKLEIVSGRTSFTVNGKEVELRSGEKSSSNSHKN